MTDEDSVFSAHYQSETWWLIIRENWVHSRASCWKVCSFSSHHYNDVIMGAMASQLTSVYSGADQRKYQSSASLTFVRGIHRSPVNSSHKWPVTRKMFPFDDVIMHSQFPCKFSECVQFVVLIRWMDGHNIAPTSTFSTQSMSIKGPKPVVWRDIFVKLQYALILPYAEHYVKYFGTGHDGGIKWKHFPRYWPFMRGIHRPPVNSRTKASGAELWCFL